jgi:hypothetical protein
MNEVLMKNAKEKNAVCVASNDSLTMRFSPSFSDFNRTGVLVPGDKRREFVAVIGNPCNQKYVSNTIS